MEFEATESAIPPGWEFSRDSQSGGVADAQPPANHWYPSRILRKYGVTCERLPVDQTVTVHGQEKGTYAFSRG